MDYKSSVNELDFFVGSHVWDDMKGDIEDWLEAVRDELEDSPSWEETCRSQGRADVIRKILAWPEITRDYLEGMKDVS